ncbi:sporulation protein YqfD [Clostridium cibarium]|uniref:sporulation protein YqfD n=1 Tax=Clostridium cibarium TaxID=2762247 RepID=UPI00311AB690
MIMFDKLKTGKLVLDVSVPIPEKFLNLLWKENVIIEKANRIDITTIRLEIDYENYSEVEKVVKKCRGKVKIIHREGFIFVVSRMKKQISLIIGGVVFIGGLYLLSNQIWAVDISTKENIAPYEIRKELTELGVKPGISKGDINVYALEKKLEDINSNILWIRARIEGSTLKIVIEEKVTPPKLTNAHIGDCVAGMDGEIKRVYVNSGTAKVVSGDIVREGDVLISGIQGREGDEYQVPAKGTVIANTFYEKEMELQISGKKLERTGHIDNDVYLNICGRKIYLKKAINKFKYYDKIETNRGVINEVMYFQREEKEVNENKDEIVKKAANQLEESLLKSLTNDAKITNKEINVQDIEDGKVRIKVMFLVEQNIAMTPN